MKLSPSNRTLAILFIAILAFSVVNTFLILYRTSTLETEFNQNLASLNQTVIQNYAALNQTYYDLQTWLNGEIDNLNARLPIGQYDYVIFRYWDYLSNVSVYVAKNGRTGLADFNSTDAAFVFNHALTNGSAVYVTSDEYVLNSDVFMINKNSARLDSDGASLALIGHRILIRGDDFQHSQYNQISGLRIVNGTVRIENSFRTTVTNMIFENCSVALELANTNTWSEGTKIDAVHFNKCLQSLVFRTNTSSILTGENSTGSYGNTEVTRCYFNLVDNSTAITVEEKAEFTDSQIQNVRIWIGEFGQYNQTGLQLGGSMYKTLLDGVVFESFATGHLENASLYAVKIGPTAYQAPILQAGVSILGGWTAMIYNPNNSWIYGVGAVFKRENVNIPIGTLNNYGQVVVIQARPQTIASFKPKITVQGGFLYNETVTVRFRLNLVDNVISNSVTKPFNSSATLWLNDDDLLRMFPSQDVIWEIWVDAKVSSASTDATVKVDLYGITT
jgi:hypothetical protein